MEILFVSSKTCTRENGIFFFVLVCAPNETHTAHTHIQVHAYNKKRFQFYVCSLLVEILREKTKTKKHFCKFKQVFFSRKRRKQTTSKNNSIKHTRNTKHVTHTKNK